jgi:hypothetical protein
LKTQTGLLGLVTARAGKKNQAPISTCEQESIVSQGEIIGTEDTSSGEMELLWSPERADLMVVAGI